MFAIRESLVKNNTSRLGVAIYIIVIQTPLLRLFLEI